MYQEDSFKVMKNNNIIAEPKNDKEFLILLKNNFIMLYNDKDVKNVIKEAKVEIKL